LLKGLPGAEQKAGKQLSVPFDTSLAEKTIGFGKYVPFEDTVLGTLKAVTPWEDRIKA